MPKALEPNAAELASGQLSVKLIAHKQLQHQVKVLNVLCSRAAVNLNLNHINELDHLQPSGKQHQRYTDRKGVLPFRSGLSGGGMLFRATHWGPARSVSSRW